ncbi:MAG: hypothetical protein N2171_03860 [Clostridia bacterium]|nr:hypothetical protein [Clostridia bacterium]
MNNKAFVVDPNAKPLTEENDLNNFLKQIGRYRDKFREQTLGFDKSVSQKAVWANKKVIAENGNKAITKITDNTISKVKKVEINGFTDAENDLIQNEHKKLLEYAMCNNDSKEVSFVFSRNFEKKAIQKGTSNMLEFTNNDCLDILNKSNNIFVMHNHPNNSSFSMLDLKFFIENDNIKYISIVKNNGNIEILTKSETYDITNLQSVVRKLAKKYIKNGSDIEFDKLIKALLFDNGGNLEYVRN